VSIRRRSELDGWGSTHVRDHAGSIDSEQSVSVAWRVVDATEEGARLLGHLYWLEVARWSHGLVRYREHADGVGLHLFGRRPLLLGFGPAETKVSGDEVVCRYPIRGGLLARHGGGALSLTQRGTDATQLRLAVSGFFPRLGVRPGFPRWSGALYALVQHRVHVAISRRYFTRLLAEAHR
jgi:hypothetical protein